MYKSALLLALFLLPLTSLRVAGVTAFDGVAALCLLMAVLNFPLRAGKVAYVFRTLAAFCVFAAIGSLLAAFNSYALGQHIVETIRYVLSMSLILMLSALSANTFRDAPAKPLTVLLLGVSLSSVVMVLQGQFGMAGLGNTYGEGAAMRFTGLAEHPVEAGSLVAVGVALGLFLADFQRRKSFLLLALLNLFALQYAASLTSAAAIAIVSLIYAIRQNKIHILAPIILVAIIVSLPFIQNTYIFERALLLLTDGASYETLNSRLTQNWEVLFAIEQGSLIIGSGFAGDGELYRIGIHNALLASIFHLGIFGLLSQLVLLWYCGKGWITSSKETKAIVTILLMTGAIFLMFHLSGPSLFRRSIWGPVLLCAGLVHEARRARFATAAVPSSGGHQGISKRRRYHGVAYGAGR